MSKAYLIVISILSITLLLSCSSPPAAQDIEGIAQASEQGIAPIIHPQSRITKASIRGLHLIDDQVGWASGSGGTILRMTDGMQWEEITLLDYIHLDFRDIEGFDSLTAVTMVAGDEGRIIRTTDGGATWTEVYTNLEEGIFLDGLDFEGPTGYCIGDPMNGETFLLKSSDYGASWHRVNTFRWGSAIAGEGSYAASGTTVALEDGHLFAAYGGDSVIRVLNHNRQLDTWGSSTAPLRIGAGCGIFSMAFTSGRHGLAVGGCYLDSLSALANVAVTHDGGSTWENTTENPPRGYRSSVAYAQEAAFFIACGRSGIDISTDQGQNWSGLSDEGYYTCSLADSTGWLMGRGGKVARLSWGFDSAQPPS